VRKNARHGVLGALVAGVIAAGVLGPAASAQGPGKQAPKNDEAVRMPVPKRSDDSPPTLWAYFMMIIILGAVFGANMIPSKRGHQD
jgi:hypothetical protein